MTEAEVKLQKWQDAFGTTSVDEAIARLHLAETTVISLRTELKKAVRAEQKATRRANRCD